MKLRRSCGILLHITSLPGPYGIGDLGPAAYEFVDFLEASGYRYWQLLPLNPTDAAFGHSPYSSHSAFAGNPLLISPDLLEREGYLEPAELDLPKGLSEGKVNFRRVEEFKEGLLIFAFQNFQKSRKRRAYKNFCNTHAHWLEDYSLYRALSGKYGPKWHTWPREYRDREAGALEKVKEELQEEVLYEKFKQFLFFSQWTKLVKYAHKKRVEFIGDIPFYINHDSADCWANPKCFKLYSRKLPKSISGVPPDLFSEDGQLWGTPVFDWNYLKKHNFQWWIERLRQNLLLFDLVRLDHFRGFAAFWEVPAGETTAKSGKWTRSPGSEFFQQVKQEFPKMPFIAEDLGSLDQPVYDLLSEFDFPGMKVLQFAFGEDMAENPYIPYNHIQNSLVYPGTHDNNTTRGWYSALGKVERRSLKNYARERITIANVHEVLNRMALNSVARICIITLQDILGLGTKAKMNLPGTAKGNWTWRATAEQIPWKHSKELREQNALYGRVSNRSEGR